MDGSKKDLNDYLEAEISAFDSKEIFETYSREGKP